MESSTTILVSLLAEMDATFLPVRNWNRPYATNVYEARKNFAAVGRTVAERKEAERALKALEDGGKVKVQAAEQITLRSTLRKVAGMLDG